MSFENIHGNVHYTLGRFLGLVSCLRSGTRSEFILDELLVIEKEYNEGRERNKKELWSDMKERVNPLGLG